MTSWVPTGNPEANSVRRRVGKPSAADVPRPGAARAAKNTNSILAAPVSAISSSNSSAPPADAKPAVLDVEGPLRKKILLPNAAGWFAKARRAWAGLMCPL